MGGGKFTYVSHLNQMFSFGLVWFGILGIACVSFLSFVVSVTSLLLLLRVRVCACAQNTHTHSVLVLVFLFFGTNNKKKQRCVLV